jgi:hypothetical protein
MIITVDLYVLRIFWEKNSTGFFYLQYSDISSTRLHLGLQVSPGSTPPARPNAASHSSPKSLKIRYLIPSGRRTCFPSIIRLTIITLMVSLKAKKGLNWDSNPGPLTPKRTPTELFSLSKSFLIRFQIYEVYTIYDPKVLLKSLRCTHIRNPVA